jgi:ABC-type glycerol-3-phosphate transport system substrate-binding protein
LVAEVLESYIQSLPRITRSSSPRKINKVHQLLIDMIKCFVFPVFLAVLFTGVSALAQQNTVTIAVVNNADMIRLKKLSPKFEEKNPDIKLNWVIVEENVLRQKVTTDVSTGSR